MTTARQAVPRIALAAAVLWCSAAAAADRPRRSDPYRDTYAGYVPSFVRAARQPDAPEFYGKLIRPAHEMARSTEPSFFTLNQIEQDSRATALVEAGVARERKRRYRDALAIYERLHDRILTVHPDVLYRVSEHGVFVPVWQYVQRRILNFPEVHLEFYRLKHDARAREALDQARKRYSLAGLADVADHMLATSYGDDATYELGCAALDQGHYLEAAELLASIPRYFPDSEHTTAELNLAIDYCHRRMGRAAPDRAASEGPSRLRPEELRRFRQVVRNTKRAEPSFHAQRHSAPHLGTDDYAPLPPTGDTLGLAEPVWRRRLTERPLRGGVVYTHPVVTRDSVIYRYKNVVYCRSILNGELRWKNDLGGRVTWQNHRDVQLLQEEILVQDGLVFSPMHKVGPSLVALDEITGELRWAHGPIAPASRAERKMRFEAAPAGGPGAVYAGYILDEIEGNTHVDTEYGVMALDSSSGRVIWRKPICRLAPGKFTAGFARPVRNRIRSFASPPLYHQGTVYYNTNAGAIAALDARSGRVKWLMRYPYYDRIHDAARDFYTGTYGPEYRSRIWNRRPSLWYHQRPLLVGDHLYVLTVDGPMALCLDRSTGKVLWHRDKPQWRWNRSGIIRACEASYFLGPISTGELLFVHSGRRGTVELVDPDTGRATWTSPEFIAHDDHPVMKYSGWQPRGPSPIAINHVFFRVGAKPFLDTQDRLHVPNYGVASLWWWGKVPGYCNQLTVLDLRKRKVVARRHHYDDETLSVAGRYIREVAPRHLEECEDVVHRPEKLKKKIRMLQEICADTPPKNRHGPFLPFSRITFRRHGQPFELRMTPRDVSMLYDRTAVQEALAGRAGPEAAFARAELAYADARYDEAAAILARCLDRISSEDLDFRQMVNQQLFQVRRQLARSAIRASRSDDELAHCLGMSRTATTIGDEINSLFAVADALAHKGRFTDAARCLRQVIRTYGDYEYEVPSVLGTRSGAVVDTSRAILDETQVWTRGSLFDRQMARGLELTRQGLPLYLSAVTPLPKDLTVHVGELAAARLARMQARSPAFSKRFERTAAAALRGSTAREGASALREFPRTAAGQEALDRLFGTVGREPDAAGRRLAWRLAQIARSNGLQVPEAYRPLVDAPTARRAETPLAVPCEPHRLTLEDEQGTEWLVLERCGDRATRPKLLFVGGRVRKRLDNKFVLLCLDQDTGRPGWRATEPRGTGRSAELRLKGKGQEPGFFKAFVRGDRVIVHGMYDVLAFGLADGRLHWRYRVPFGFEIRHALMSGDFFVLSGDAETVALYIRTRDPMGEVVWQQTEQGGPYVPPYFHGDLLVSVRKMPFNVTVRYRTTGRLIGRLALPDLSLNAEHPILGGDGPAALPAAHDGKYLAVTDSWYYILLDVEKLAVAWKRLIDRNDITRDPPLRLALNGEYLVVQKEDYVDRAVHVLSSRTGRLLWHTDPKVPERWPPMHSLVIHEDRIYGIEERRGEGFALACRDGKTGTLLFRRVEKGYAGDPAVTLSRGRYGPYVVARVRDRQDVELKAFDGRSRKRVLRLHAKGYGAFGVHGRVSQTVQNGRLVLLGAGELQF
ncbi:MAG: PQQ-binding-like beta-propeller repeat protein [Planctomycetota bacterium]